MHDTASAASLLGLWRGEPLETDDPGAIARLAAEHGLREGHQGTFAPLLWLLLRLVSHSCHFSQ